MPPLQHGVGTSCLSLDDGTAAMPPLQHGVTIFEVPPSGRFGPWTHRKWEIASRDGNPVREVIPVNELLCRVTFVNGALDEQFLEKLFQYGLSTSSMLTRDKALIASFG